MTVVGPLREVLNGILMMFERMSASRPRQVVRDPTPFDGIVGAGNRRRAGITRY
jgi:hypothetical protein